jgi:hypothetical protein
MLASLALTAVLWPSAVTQECAPNSDSFMIGVARDSNGNFLYCEIVTRPKDQHLRVDYTRQHQPFATKELTYGQNPKMPEVSQQDTRSGEVREARLVDNQVVLKYQPNRHKKPGEAHIALAKADVVDAGFDNYVRLHWDELTSGAIVPVNFASIAHLKVLPLRIRNQPLSACDTRVKEGFCFQVEIDNALLRLVLGNIKLLYDTQHRLQKFDGVVNLNNDNEGNQKAVIHYYYRQDYLEKPVRDKDQTEQR